MLDIYNILSEVYENGNSINWWKYSAIPHGLGRVYLKYQSLTELTKCDVMSEDWDNLVIVDACRYDMFRETVQIEGDLHSRYSKGSATPEFVRNNFSDGQFSDTVYVTANPYVDILARHSFFKTLNLWKTHWNESLGTVRPEDVVRAAKEANRDHPNKRLIIHFMQPHYPFIGEFGQTEIRGNTGFDKSRDRALGESEREEQFNVWELAQRGEIALETIARAYQENLEVVLPHVEEITGHLPGKTVVTSDHGNLLGERPKGIPVRMFGHPERVPVRELIHVPWLEVPFDSRKRIEEGELRAVDDQSDVAVESRLKDLGYIA